MYSIAAVVLLVIFAILYFLRRAGHISAGDAKTHLKNGALIIDVRSPGEFNANHLPNALNHPVDQIESSLPRRIKDRNQCLLLHCQSGLRSGVAKKKLQSMGYVNAFNLGSYSNATKAVKGS